MIGLWRNDQMKFTQSAVSRYCLAIVVVTTSADHTRAPCNSRKLVILGEKIFWKDESVLDYLYLVTKTFSYYRPVFPVSQNLFFEVHFWFLLRIRSGTCWETRFWPSIWSDEYDYHLSFSTTLFELILFFLCSYTSQKPNKNVFHLFATKFFPGNPKNVDHTRAPN